MAKIYNSGRVKKLTLNGIEFTCKGDEDFSFAREGVSVESEQTNNANIIKKVSPKNAYVKDITLICNGNEYNQVVDWHNNQDVVEVSIITANNEAIDSNMQFDGDVPEKKGVEVSISMTSSHLQITQQ